jgi:hypothetical protein
VNTRRVRSASAAAASDASARSIGWSRYSSMSWKAREGGAVEQPHREATALDERSQLVRPSASRDRADALTQETFLRAWAHFDQFDPTRIVEPGSVGSSITFGSASGARRGSNSRSRTSKSLGPSRMTTGRTSSPTRICQRTCSGR